jgi:hypothetical protein
MSTIDDLVHDAEVEAEVLRAISHMTPYVAQEFLVELAFKIGQAHRPLSTDMPKARESAQRIVTEPMPDVEPVTFIGRKRRGLTGAIEDLLYAHGELSSTAIMDALGLNLPTQRTNTTAMLRNLQQRGILLRRLPHPEAGESGYIYWLSEDEKRRVANGGGT